MKEDEEIKKMLVEEFGSLYDSPIFQKSDNRFTRIIKFIVENANELSNFYSYFHHIHNYEIEEIHNLLTTFVNKIGVKSSQNKLLANEYRENNTNKSEAYESFTLKMVSLAYKDVFRRSDYPHVSEIKKLFVKMIMYVQ